MCGGGTAPEISWKRKKNIKCLWSVFYSVRLKSHFRNNCKNEYSVLCGLYCKEKVCNMDWVCAGLESIHLNVWKRKSSVVKLTFVLKNILFRSNEKVKNDGLKKKKKIVGKLFVETLTDKNIPSTSYLNLVTC